MYKLLIVACCLFLASCNKEYVEIKGEIVNMPDMTLAIKIKGLAGNEKVLDSIQVVNGEFSFYSEQIKPPFKLSIGLNEHAGFDVWIGQYGKSEIFADGHKLKHCEVQECAFNKELARFKGTIDNMYISPLNNKVKWVDSLRYANVKLTDDQYKIQQSIQVEIKKAEKLRIKSMLKTLRKNPKSNVACALVFDEYQNLTKRQRAVLSKSVSMYFSDTGMGWQVRH